MNRRNVLLSLFAILICQAVPLLALDQKTMTAGMDRLRQMSELERSRFDRNLADFQKLSDAEKQRYRHLHRELVDDTARGGSLAKLLQTYAVWVQTLTPTQRDELAKETVLSQKIALIRKFKEEQEESGETQDAQQTETATEEPIPPVTVTINKKEALAQKDMKNVMGVLVNHLSQDAMKPEFTDRQLSDFIPIIHASVQSYGGRYPEWPSESLLKEMTASLSKESATLVTRADYKGKRDAMVRYVLMGVLKQARDLVPIPTDSEKSQIWEGLTPVERERITNLPLERLNGYLVRKSMELKGGDVLSDFKKLPEYLRQVEELFKLFEVSPPAKLVPRAKRGDLKRTSANRSNRAADDK